MVHEEQGSPPRFTLEAARKVAAALAEVLPGDRYEVVAQPGMGYEGVAVTLLGVAGDGDVVDPYWYFAETYGGEDGYSAHLRVYFTHQDGSFADEHSPAGAPLVDADPIRIAQWIAEVVRRGPPEAGAGPDPVPEFR